MWTASSAKAWRSKRVEKFKAPSGDEYVLSIPDILTLIASWQTAGVKFTVDKKEFATGIAQDHVVAHFLIKFVKKPKITKTATEKTLGVKEVMRDRADTLAIYKEIIKNFTGITDEQADWFRKLAPSTSGGAAGTSQP